MGVMEVILLVLGILVFIVSFLLPAGKKEDAPDIVRMQEETIRELVEKKVDEAKSQINDIAGEAVTYSMEKAERSMDRLTNEKMMAVNEYSDTVLAEINKNHKEVVFLYDMLNDKHENLKTIVSEASKKSSEIKQTLQDAEITVKEARQAADEMAAESAKRMEELKASEKVMEAGDFKPIEAEKIEIEQLEAQTSEAPEEKEQKKQKPKAVRKPRAPKAVKEEAVPLSDSADEGEAKALAANVIPGAAPEVAVALKEEEESVGRNNNERILALHKAGKSNMAIAKELGLGIGEVKLVIDLFEGM